MSKSATPNPWAITTAGAPATGPESAPAAQESAPAPAPATTVAPPAPNPPPPVAQAGEVALVRMVREPGKGPGPLTADVHPDEVQNYSFHGWTVQE